VLREVLRQFASFSILTWSKNRFSASVNASDWKSVRLVRVSVLVFSTTSSILPPR
jgi:hypothetical protein